MAAPICHMVSQLFYRGHLRVAGDAVENTEWQTDRELAFGDIAAGEHVVVREVSESGVWSQHYQGPIRYTSAEMIAQLLEAALARDLVKPGEVVVLTPFRAQRALLRQRMSARKIKQVKVSTVHRAQGSEAPVVIFDPVDGANNFLLTEDARRLVNVALSRAQAKIVMFLSPEDRHNPLLAQIWNMVRLSSDERPTTPVAELVSQPGFPSDLVGRRIAIGEQVGEVSRVASDESRLWMINAFTGAEHCFLVSYLRGNTVAKDA